MVEVVGSDPGLLKAVIDGLDGEYRGVFVHEDLPFGIDQFCAQGKQIGLPLPLKMARHDPYPVKLKITHLKTRPQADINTAARTGVMMVGNLESAVA